MKQATRNYIESQKNADTTIARIWSPEWEAALEACIASDLAAALRLPGVHPDYRAAVATMCAKSFSGREIDQIRIVAEMDKK
jgi:hypothetical protein